MEKTGPSVGDLLNMSSGGREGGSLKFINIHFHIGKMLNKIDYK